MSRLWRTTGIKTVLLREHVTRYALLGLLIAFLSIITASLILSWQLTGAISIHGVILAHKSNPALWLLDLTPFLFAYWGQSFFHQLVYKAEEVIKQETEQFESRETELENLLSHQSTHDYLTGLPNQKLLSERIRQIIHEQQQKKWLLLDISAYEFKDIGYHYGEFNLHNLIRQFTEKLRLLFADADLFGGRVESIMLARLNNQDFAVLIPLQDNDNVEEILHTITQTIRMTFYIDGELIKINPIAGAAIYPDHAHEASLLIERAMQSVHHADKGKALWAIYHPGMVERNKEPTLVFNEIKQAIANQNLELYYQPTYNFSNMNIIGAEALVRLNHQSLGLVEAEKFISIIEGTVLIRELSQLVLSQAIRQLAEWHKAGYLVMLSVNLSADDAVNHELSETLTSLMLEHDCPAEYLTLEFTEQAILSDQSRSFQVLQEISRLGIKICVDNFCSGYTSFIYLTHFPIHEIKIDRSFTAYMLQDEYKYKIVEAMIHIASIFEIQISAEGVENDQVMHELRKLGCRKGKGFNFSEAIGITRFNDLLRQQQDM